MAAEVVIETIAPETDPDPDPEHEEQNRLLSIWNSWPRKILLCALLPLGLYLFDIITDLSLAAQYYNSGDLNWFGWTLGFVLGPTLIINFRYLQGYFREDNEPIKYVRCLLSTLQLSVILEYFGLFRLLLKGKDVEKLEEDDLPAIHLLEATLECVPQLCLQGYILILTNEQVSDLKVITMLASLLAAVKATVTYFYYATNKSDRTWNYGFVTRVILLSAWKVVELSVRVLAIGLFASAFKAWILLPIGLHLLLMALTFIKINSHYRTCPDVMFAPLLMAVDTFSTTFSMNHKQLFWLNSLLTLLGNITMVTVWYTLKVGEDWYDTGALLCVVWGSIASIGNGFVYVAFYHENLLPESHPTICCQMNMAW
ncbi:XK-related protein 6-like [Branchiostoma floridae x Branchiostoma belcheri]